MSSRAHFGGGVTARILSVRPTHISAQLPGEISGPGVAVAIAVRNRSGKPITLDSVVNLYYGSQRTPALSVLGPPTRQLSGRLAPGARTTGVYGFTLARADRRRVRIEFSYAPTAPVVVWQGSV